MVGKLMPYGQGVSWPTVNSQAQTYVEDVATREGVHLFRCVCGVCEHVCMRFCV